MKALSLLNTLRISSYAITDERSQHATHALIRILMEKLITDRSRAPTKDLYASISIKRFGKVIAFSAATHLDYSSIANKDLCICDKSRFLWYSYIGLCAENYKTAPPEIKLDYSITLEAVQNSGGNLAFTCHDFRDNISIVKAACSNQGLAIKYASARLKANKEIALIAIKQNSLAYFEIDPSLRNDLDILKASSIHPQ
jgi:Domain of unknown function (DUF4116)